MKHMILWLPWFEPRGPALFGYLLPNSQLITKMLSLSSQQSSSLVRYGALLLVVLVGTVAVSSVTAQSSPPITPTQSSPVLTFMYSQFATPFAEYAVLADGVTCTFMEAVNVSATIVTIDPFIPTYDTTLYYGNEGCTPQYLMTNVSSHGSQPGGLFFGQFIMGLVADIKAMYTVGEYNAVGVCSNTSDPFEYGLEPGVCTFWWTNYYQQLIVNGTSFTFKTYEGDGCGATTPTFEWSGALGQCVDVNNWSGMVTLTKPTMSRTLPTTRSKKHQAKSTSSVIHHPHHRHSSSSSKKKSPRSSRRNHHISTPTSTSKKIRHHH